jgi:mono/diheme cytochrome c family protein
MIAGTVSVFLITLTVRAVVAQQSPPTTTVEDKVYTKEQAARGQALYDKVCSKCHALDDKPSTLEGPSLAGDDFLKRWDGKSIYDIALGIKLGMPPDGSIVMDDASTPDALAFVLKSNGFPDGDRELRVDASSKTLMFVKAK